MVLAFVAAVEQNILGFRPMTAKGAGEVAASLTLTPVTDHLADVVEGLKYAEEKHR